MADRLTPSQRFRRHSSYHLLKILERNIRLSGFTVSFLGHSSLFISPFMAEKSRPEKREPRCFGIINWILICLGAKTILSILFLMKYSPLYRALRSSAFSDSGAGGRGWSRRDDGVCLTTLGPLAGPKGGVLRQAPSRLRGAAESRHDAGPAQGGGSRLPHCHRHRHFHRFTFSWKNRIFAPRN